MRKPFVATIWAIAGRFIYTSVGFVIGIILARLLSPSDYGIVGVTGIFLAVANTFIDSGFSNALLRKLDKTEEDLSTCFIFNTCVALILYLIIFFAAPFIATFFNAEVVCPIIRLVGLNLVINSLSIVQRMLLTSDLKLKEQTFIGLYSQIPSGILAIFLAYKGFGVYALVFQGVLNSCFTFFNIWRFSKWRPKLIFSMESFRYLWSFGSKMVAANLIGTIFNNLNSFIIGKFIGKSDLGYFTKANNLSNYPNGIITGTINKIGVPVFAKYQNDKTQLLNHYRNTNKYIMFIVCPIYAILFVIAEPFIVFLWTDKWQPSAELLQLLIIAHLFIPVSTMNLVLLQILNHTDVTLKLEIYKKPTYIVSILIGVYFGLKGLIVAHIFNSFFGACINMVASKKYINYSYKKQFLDIFYYILTASLAVIPSYYIVIKLNTPLFFKVFVGCIIIPIIYFGILWIKNDYLFLQTQKKLLLKFKQKLKIL